MTGLHGWWPKTVRTETLRTTKYRSEVTRRFRPLWSLYGTLRTWVRTVTLGFKVSCRVARQARTENRSSALKAVGPVKKLPTLEYIRDASGLNVCRAKITIQVWYVTIQYSIHVENWQIAASLVSAQKLKITETELKLKKVWSWDW